MTTLVLPTHSINNHYVYYAAINKHSVQDDIGQPALDLIYFPQWCFGVAALLLYAVTITHLFCGNPITVFLVSSSTTMYSTVLSTSICVCVCVIPELNNRS